MYQTFLKDIASIFYYNFSEVMSGIERKVPLLDRHYSLQILLELAIQRGTITAVMDAVTLLLNLSEKNSSVVDNRY